MSIPKPKYCEQKWLSMSPGKNGRICGKCEKNIIDFSTMKWSQIVDIQKKGNYSVCGMYSDKQIESWGTEVPSKPTTIYKTAASIILALNQFNSSEVVAQDIVKTEQHEVAKTLINNNKTTHIQSNIKHIIKGTIYSNDSIPLDSVKVYIPELNIESWSDSKGNFILEINQSIDSIDQFYLKTHLNGYLDKRILIKDPPSNLTILNLHLNSYVKVPPAYFYVKKPTLWEKLKWKLGYFK